MKIRIAYTCFLAGLVGAAGGGVGAYWLGFHAGEKNRSSVVQEAGTPSWMISDLSMRFTHPELYESRDGLPMYTALYEFKRRGLLHRGMAATEVRNLLGEPSAKSERETSNDRPNILWNYSLHASALTIEFSPDGDALSFTEVKNGDTPNVTQW